MRYRNKILTLVYAAFMLTAGFVYEASAQSRYVYVRRPVIVRSYVYRDPFWYSRYYDSYYSNPYYREMERRYYLRRDLAGNERELAEHLKKYRADGVITTKERRELEDDYKDVQNSRARLRNYRY